MALPPAFVVVDAAVVDVGVGVEEEELAEVGGVDAAVLELSDEVVVVVLSDVVVGGGVDGAGVELDVVVVVEDGGAAEGVDDVNDDGDGDEDDGDDDAGGGADGLEDAPPRAGSRGSICRRCR